MSADALLGGAQERRLFEEALYGSTAPSAPSFAIPRFFFKSENGREKNPVLWEAARERHLARRSARAPDNVELRRLWERLTAAAETDHSSSSLSISTHKTPREAVDSPGVREGGARASSEGGSARDGRRVVAQPAKPASEPPTVAAGDGSEDTASDRDKHEEAATAATAASASASAWLSYAQFRACGRDVAEETDKFDAFFKPSVFFRLRRDRQQRISANQFFDLVMRKVSAYQIRLSFCLYDADGDGYVHERDLEQFVLDHISSMPRLEQLHQSFFATYAVYATRKFMFFLDPQRIGKIKITSLLTSDVIHEFNELLEHDLPEAYEESNWFSMSFVTRVHATFVNLDADANSLLSKEEFAAYDGGCLTAAAADRVFQISRNYNHQLDYKAYLDFILAVEYPLRRPSLKYLFRLLDVDQKGYLTTSDLHYFWRAMLDHPRMEEVADPPPIEHIKDEIFDMIKPKDPYHITFKDLEDCGQGDVIANMLINVNGFFAYETREGSVPES